MTVVKKGNKYSLISHKGKTLKTGSKKAVIKREKQIQFFKNNEQYKKDHGRGIPMKKKKGK